MSGIYGLVTLLLIFILGGIITPSADIQLRGWRRVRKQGDTSLPLLLRCGHRLLVRPS